MFPTQVAPVRHFFSQAGAILVLDDQCRLKLIGSGQQAGVYVELMLDKRWLAQPAGGQDLVHTEPEGLTILRDRRHLWTDACSRMTIEVTAQRIEELA